jgi:hypothetical protein
MHSAFVANFIKRHHLFSAMNATDGITILVQDYPKFIKDNTSVLGAKQKIFS